MTSPGRAGYEPRPGGEAERRGQFDQNRRFVDVMRWGGGYDPNSLPYNEGDVVYDDGWTMVCAEPTGCTERPAPQPIGDPEWVYAGTSPTRQDLASQILFGNTYTFVEPGYFTGYRIWTVAGNAYTIYTINTDGQISEVATFEGQGGWQEFAWNSILAVAGTKLSVLALVREPDPSPTVWTGNWNYQTPNNEGIPGTGVALHGNRLTSSLRFNTTDDDGGDRTTELLALQVGDVINGPGGIAWAVQAVSDQGIWVDVTVAPTTQGAPDGLFEFSFETVTPTPITFLEDVDYWLSNYVGQVSGICEVDGVPVAGAADNAYGTDILVQAAAISDQWELVAPSDSVAASTSTATVTAQTLGTHEDFYDYAKFVNVFNIGSTWTPVGSLSIMLPAAGTYELGASATWQYSITNRSTFIRWRINGGLWYERVKEPKDTTDVFTDYYAFPADYPAGPFLVEFEMRKEANPGTLDLHYLDIFMERKK